jgi:hypothetical protein
MTEGVYRQTCAVFKSGVKMAGVSKALGKTIKLVDAQS